jgi:hypothetical protein
MEQRNHVRDEAREFLGGAYLDQGDEAACGLVFFDDDVRGDAEQLEKPHANKVMSRCRLKRLAADVGWFCGQAQGGEHGQDGWVHRNPLFVCGYFKDPRLRGIETANEGVYIA